MMTSSPCDGAQLGHPQRHLLHRPEDAALLAGRAVADHVAVAELVLGEQEEPGEEVADHLLGAEPDGDAGHRGRCDQRRQRNADDHDAERCGDDHHQCRERPARRLHHRPRPLELLRSDVVAIDGRADALVDVGLPAVRTPVDQAHEEHRADHEDQRRQEVVAQPVVERVDRRCASDRGGCRHDHPITRAFSRVYSSSSILPSVCRRASRSSSSTALTGPIGNAADGGGGRRRRRRPLPTAVHGEIGERADVRQGDGGDGPQRLRRAAHLVVLQQFAEDAEDEHHPDEEQEEPQERPQHLTGTELRDHRRASFSPRILAPGGAPDTGIGSSTN